MMNINVMVSNSTRIRVQTKCSRVSLAYILYRFSCTVRDRLSSLRKDSLEAQGETSQKFTIFCEDVSNQKKVSQSLYLEKGETLKPFVHGSVFQRASLTFSNHQFSPRFCIPVLLCFQERFSLSYLRDDSAPTRRHPAMIIRTYITMILHSARRQTSARLITFWDACSHVRIHCGLLPPLWGPSTHLFRLEPLLRWTMA